MTHNYLRITINCAVDIYQCSQLWHYSPFDLHWDSLAVALKTVQKVSAFVYSSERRTYRHHLFNPLLGAGYTGTTVYVQNHIPRAYPAPCFSSSSPLLSCPRWKLRRCCAGHKNSTSLSWLHLQDKKQWVRSWNNSMPTWPHRATQTVRKHNLNCSIVTVCACVD